MYQELLFNLTYILRHTLLFAVSLLGAILIYHFIVGIHLPLLTLPFPVLSPYVFLTFVLVLFAVFTTLFHYPSVAQSVLERDIEKIILRYIGSFVSFIILASLLSSLLFLFPFDSLIKRQLRESFFAPVAMNGIQGIDTLFQSLVHSAPYGALGFYSVDPQYNERIPLSYSKKTSRQEEEFEKMLFEKINRERRIRQLYTFMQSDVLAIQAEAHVKDMIAHQYFAYKAYNGLPVVTRLEEGGVRFSKASESVALVQTIDGAVYGFINTPHNADNILSPGFRNIGISVYDVGSLGLLVSVIVTD